MWHLGHLTEWPRDECFTCLVHNSFTKKGYNPPIIAYGFAYLHLEIDILVAKAALEWVKEKNCNGQGSSCSS